MTKLINKSKLTTFTNKLWDKITASFVSKTLPNTVTGETMITNGYVGGESKVTKRHNETRANMSYLNSNTSFYGIPSLSVPARTYVDKIICIMDDSAGDIGANATGVNVGVVSKATGRILEYLKTNQTETIIANPLTSGSDVLTGDKAISISINKAWQEEVYFIVGAMKMMAGYIGSLTISLGGDELKEVGYNLGNGTPGNYIGRMAIYTSKYSLNEIATKSLFIDDIKNDYVSKTKENLVTGKTTLTNGWLVDNALSIINNTNAIHTISDNTAWCGTPNLNVAANTYVSYICIAVNDSFDIGREINNIKIGVVKNNGNRVHEIITREGKATVVKNTMGNIDSSKIIMYPIRKSFSEQVYFIAGFNGMKWGNRSGNWQTVRPNIPFPDVDRVLEINNGNYVPQYFLLSDGIPLNNIIPLINTKANLSNDNTFSGANRFDGSVRLNENVDIRYVTKYEQLLLDGDNKHGSNWAVYFDRNIYIPADSYVTYLDIRVADDVSIGSELSDIYIYEVHRGDSINNDRIVGVPFNNARIRVSDVDGYGKCIRAQFNRTFERDTYCIVGQRASNGKILMGNDNKGNIRQAISNNPFVLNSNYTISSIARPTNDKVIHRYNIERVGVLQDDIKNINNVLATTVKNTDIGNEANKIPRVGANGKLDPRILPAEQNGGVRTVNGQSPGSNGDVTVLAEHIKYANGQDTTVKGAIDNKPNTVNGQGVNRSNGNITIYSDNIDISSSNSKKISQVLDEKLNKSEVSNSGNNVPRLNNGKLVYEILPDTIVRTDKDNVFRSYCPKVNRTFTMASFNVEGYDRKNFEVFQNESGLLKYVCNYSAKFNNNTSVTHLIIPIKNGQVGDSVEAIFFVINNDNRVIQVPTNYKSCTVEDIDMVGCKCIRLPVGRTFNERVAFGFSVVSKNINGRRIGLAYATDSSYNSNVWIGNTPDNNMAMSNNSPHYIFPFKIGHETTSELVTRFELEQVTQMYPKTLIGEMKQLSYDAGNSLEDGINTWLRANGQAINSNDYPELYEKFNTPRTDDDIEVSIPAIDNQVGYYYICAK